MTTHRWSTRPADADVARRMAGELKVPLPMATLLVGRGFESADAASAFLRPRLSEMTDPFRLDDMRPAVDRIWAALAAGEPIVVFGDYDADGVTATALLMTMLERLGGRVEAFLPSRFEDGYGFTPAALDRCLQRHRPRLIVTVDCGTTSVAAVENARAVGVDVVITDHHEVGSPLPAAAAVVNPKRGADARVLPLAGVGVAFKLCHALLKHALENDRARAGRIDLREWLDLVAVGTVADVVPLTGENRTLVRHGMLRLGQNPCPGLAALMEVARVRAPLDDYHIGFIIGPRLNAAGRVGSADAALRLLRAADRAAAQPLAVELDDANSERRNIEEDIRADAEARLAGSFDGARDFGLVVAGDGWHEGTIGIVAARLCSRFNRPTVVVSFDGEGRGKGSGRSIERLNLVETLHACADLLEAHGGHPMAAGVALRRENLAAFTERFNALCREKLAGQDLRKQRLVDAWVTLDEADAGLLAAAAELAPTGLGNPAPLWGLRGLRVDGEPRVVGEKHLKFAVTAGRRRAEVIAFNMDARRLPGGAIDVLARLREDRYRGEGRLQLDVQDVREHGAPESAGES